MSSYYSINKKEFIYLLAFIHQYLEKSKKDFIDTTFLQKAIFLLSRSVSVLEKALLFRPHELGPHSYKLENAVLATLINDEILEKKIRTHDKIFFLTEEGKGIANESFDSLTEKEKNVVDWVVDQLIGLTLYELLALVYYTYEDMTIKSEIKNEIDSKREELALSLFNKGKISFEKTSEIAELSKDELKKIITH